MCRKDQLLVGADDQCEVSVVDVRLDGEAVEEGVRCHGGEEMERRVRVDWRRGCEGEECNVVVVV